LGLFLTFFELDKQGQYELSLYKKTTKNKTVSENDMKRMKVSK